MQTDYCECILRLDIWGDLRHLIFDKILEVKSILYQGEMDHER